MYRTPRRGVGDHHKSRTELELTRGRCQYPPAFLPILVGLLGCVAAEYSQPCRVTANDLRKPSPVSPARCTRRDGTKTLAPRSFTILDEANASMCGLRHALHRGLVDWPLRWARVYLCANGHTSKHSLERIGGRLALADEIGSTVPPGAGCPPIRFMPALHLNHRYRARGFSFRVATMGHGMGGAGASYVGGLCPSLPSQGFG